MEMPQLLKDFLGKSNDKDAEQIWDYFDGNSDCVHEMIDLLFKTHEEQFNKLCIEPEEGD